VAGAVKTDPATNQAKAALGELRTRIDELDQAIQEAINQRAELAKRVAEAKGGDGQVEDFYRPDREAEILRRVVERNRGPLSAGDMARLFKEIMSACLALQKPLTVAFLGPEGTFTQAAVLKHFGHFVRILPLDAIDAVFREVEAGSAQYGVVPVENSTEGVISYTLDMFLHSPLKICGEVGMRIHHFLMSKAGRLDAVRRVYSHQQSLGQCRKWLDLKLPAVDRVAVSSNAEAARRAAGEAGAAAIAGEVAAETYGLSILAANIEDDPDNTTRFLVIGYRLVPATGRDKTSLLLSTRNAPGALYALLEPFARNGVSMTRIESRPSRRENWEYVFFADVEGHAEDRRVKAALGEIAERASLLKVLGSYPRAVL
jgi:chorismate mutase/prephenate dehydratase